jgi:rhodanese-related sulfurtransferase
MLAGAKANIREITTEEAEAELSASGSVLLDVREPDEYEQGAVAGSVHLPRGNLETSIEGRIPDKSAHVLVMCAGGVRSAFAADTMQQLGYTDVASIMGGFNRWKDEGRAWAAPRTLTPEQRTCSYRRSGTPVS